MKQKRILYNITTTYKRIVATLHRYNLNLNYAVVIFVTIGIIIFLSYNIYNTINAAEINYKIEVEERQKLEKLKKENTQLEKELAYLKSIDAKEILALEGFKLSHPDTKLYKINSETQEIVFIEDENLDPVNLEDNEFWWNFVLFHRL